jgi:hypothetical protein
MVAVVTPFDAEASRAKLYVDLQRIVNAGDQTRASDLRALPRAKEAELVTLGRLGEAVRDRHIASHHPRYWPAIVRRRVNGRRWATAGGFDWKAPRYPH